MARTHPLRSTIPAGSVFYASHKEGQRESSWLWRVSLGERTASVIIYIKRLQWISLQETPILLSPSMII